MRLCIKLLTERSAHGTYYILVAIVLLVIIIYQVPTHCTKNFTCISHLILTAITIRWICPFYRKGHRVRVRVRFRAVK